MIKDGIGNKFSREPDCEDRSQIKGFKKFMEVAE